MNSIVRVALLVTLIALFALSAAAHMLPMVRLRLETILNRAVIPDLTDAQVARLQLVSERLLRLKRLRLLAVQNRQCISDRAESITHTLATLNAARDCLYNSLTYSDFDGFRAVCKTRASFVACAADADASCITSLAAAEVACAAIGRTGPAFTPPPCPLIAPLKAAWEDAVLVDCGTGLLDLTQLDNKIAKNEAIIDAILPAGVVPSNPPRFPLF